MRLARVGIETVKGFILMKNLRGEKNADRASSGRKSQRSELLKENVQFVDVRNRTEHANGHAAGSDKFAAQLCFRENSIT